MHEEKKKKQPLAIKLMRQKKTVLKREGEGGLSLLGGSLLISEMCSE